MRRDYKLFLEDICNAIEAIEKFVEGMSFEQFEEDDRTVSAVMKKFEIIGEATKNLPDFITEKYADVPWEKMAGFRDILVHAYFGTDFKVVWDAIHDALPEVKPKIFKAVNENLNSNT